MAIVGFNFTKLNIENKGQFKANEKISSDLKIDDVVIEKTGADESKDLIKFIFGFVIDYAGSGNALLAGEVVYLDEPDNIKEILKNWTEQHAVKAELLQQILNTVLFRCNIKALTMSQDVGLPPHFKLPRVEQEPINPQQ